MFLRIPEPLPAHSKLKGTGKRGNVRGSDRTVWMEVLESEYGVKSVSEVRVIGVCFSRHPGNQLGLRRRRRAGQDILVPVS